MKGQSRKTADRQQKKNVVQLGEKLSATLCSNRSEAGRPKSEEKDPSESVKSVSLVLSSVEVSVFY
jgi:hypothetical protein